MGRPKIISGEIRLNEQMTSFFPAVADYFRDVYPAEACCIIASREGETRLFKAPNISKNPTYFFEMDPRLFIEIEDLGFQVQMLAHSHPDGDCAPSRSDIEGWFFTDLNQKSRPIFPGVLFAIMSVHGVDVSAAVYGADAGHFVEINV